jgi:hypothetical protein
MPKLLQKLTPITITYAARGRAEIDEDDKV